MDEINIVVNGTATFKMGDVEVDVRRGSIVWVKEGIGHYFHTLNDDFDVLILFEKKKE